MELLRAYLKQTKIFLIAFVFAVAASAAVVCLYQLPAEAVIYMAVLWLGAGAAAFLYGYVRYRQKAQTLCLVEKAPEINLDRLDETTDEVELLYREIIRKLDGMRMGVETDRQRSLEEMTDYYTMWAHQIKTPIFALRLLLQEEPERNRESLAQLFRIEQYVEMVLGYLRTEDMSADLKLARSSLDRIIREQIHKYAGIFVAKKLSLSYEGTDATVLTDEKWLGFVIGQILSNALNIQERAALKSGWRMSVETGHRIQHRQSLSSQTPASESRQKTFHGSSKKATQESTAGRTTAPPGSDCI